MTFSANPQQRASAVGVKEPTELLLFLRVRICHPENFSEKSVSLKMKIEFTLRTYKKQTFCIFSLIFALFDASLKYSNQR